MEDAATMGESASTCYLDVPEEETTAYKVAGAMNTLKSGSLCQSQGTSNIHQHLACVRIDDDLSHLL